MTGVEHYREAERLLTEANRATRGEHEQVTALATRAQAHATMALAAANGLDEPEGRGDGEYAHTLETGPDGHTRSQFAAGVLANALED